MKGPTDLWEGNLGMTIYSTNLDYEFKNKYVDISYHKLRESASSDIFNPLKVCTTVNQFEILKNVHRWVW